MGARCRGVGAVTLVHGHGVDVAWAIVRRGRSGAVRCGRVALIGGVSRQLWPAARAGDVERAQQLQRHDAGAAA